MTLESFLVLRLGADILSARCLIRDGFAEVNGQAIKMNDFPVSTHDAVRISDFRLAKMPRGYFALQELQRERKLFSDTTDALCIGTDRGALEYLLENKAAVSFAGLEASGAAGANDIIANPMTEKITEKHRDKFNFIIIGSRFGLFVAFHILENNSDAILSRGTALLELKKDEACDPETLSKFSNGAGFYIDSTIRFEIDPESGWVLLKKKKREL